jgi:hypothetical protein
VLLAVDEQRLGHLLVRLEQRSQLGRHERARRLKISGREREDGHVAVQHRTAGALAD